MDNSTSRIHFWHQIQTRKNQWKCRLYVTPWILENKLHGGWEGSWTQNLQNSQKKHQKKLKNQKRRRSDQQQNSIIIIILQPKRINSPINRIKKHCRTQNSNLASKFNERNLYNILKPHYTNDEYRQDQILEDILTRTESTGRPGYQFKEIHIKERKEIYYFQQHPVQIQYR